MGNALRLFKSLIASVLDRIVDVFLDCIIHLMYGKKQQKKSGWRGKFARVMANHAAAAKQSEWKTNAELTARIEALQREQGKKAKGLIWYRYNYRLCAAILGSHLDDWFEFHFYEKRWKEKRKCLTFWRNKFFNDLINERERNCTEILDNKVSFAEHWHDYYGRNGSPSMEQRG